GARALVSDRREQVAAWERESAPDVIVAGAPAAPPPPPAKPVDGMLRGMGVSSGRATGPARLIRHPAEGHRLKQGDVLVAPSTDPGWTPLFLRASAVVMEVGGMLSHGAIVAREYALPAVVNIPGLLGALRDGQNVTVDGNAGTVVLTDPPG
ncbi:MAG: pyruvate, phosphate dikinase, partial [Candidatus Brocadiae bacterium]|nr:pyruvate, phosphate dikinase [Candidatus Brocadiia bacterium]